SAVVLNIFFLVEHLEYSPKDNTIPPHDALPINARGPAAGRRPSLAAVRRARCHRVDAAVPASVDYRPARDQRVRHRRLRRAAARSEEHTSELQSLRQIVCRLPLEKNNKKLQLLL